MFKALDDALLYFITFFLYAGGKTTSNISNDLASMTRTFIKKFLKIENVYIQSPPWLLS